MRFEELEHTADLRLRVRAATLDDLFTGAAISLMQVMYGDDLRPGMMERAIEIDARDQVSLMQEFLSEVLFLSEVDNLVFSRCEASVSGHGIRARLTGEPFQPARHRGGREVKGITYSGLHIFKEGGECILDIILDV